VQHLLCLAQRSLGSREILRDAGGLLLLGVQL